MERHRLWITVATVSMVVLGIGIAAMVAAAWAGMPAIAPALAIAAIGMAVGVPIALRHTDVVIVVLIIADLSRLSDVSSEIIGVGIFQPLLILAIISLGIGLATGRLRFQWSPIYLLILGLLAVQGLSVLTAGAIGVAVSALLESSKDLVYLAIVVVWMGSHRSLRLATTTLVATMATLAALTVIGEFVFHNSVDFFGLSNVDTAQVGAVTLRHSGPESDANFWARSLVIVLPIALSWWALAKNSATRWLAGGAFAVIGFGLYLTQSRGGLIAAGLAIVLWLVMAGRPYVRWLALAPVVLVVLVSIPGVGSRLMTLTDISGAEQGIGDPSLQGRVGAQRAGIDMFLEHPILGVGVGGFLTTVPEYQRKLGIQTQVIDAHNLYLEIAAENGAIGLMAWGLLFGYGLYVALRAWLVSGQSGSEKNRWINLMAAGVVAGLVAWLGASVFLHAASLRVAFTVLAVAVGLDLVTRDDTTVAPGTATGDETGIRSTTEHEPAANRIGVPVIRRPAVVGGLIVLVFVAMSWWVLPATPERWVTERHVALGTSEDAGGQYGVYNNDLLSRGLVGSTYAALLEDPEITQRAAALLDQNADEFASVRVKASYSPRSQVITLRVSGDETEQVAEMAAGIVDQGTTFIEDLDQPFVVTAIGQGSTGKQDSPLTDMRRFASFAAIGLIAVLGIGWLLSSARQRVTVLNGGRPLPDIWRPGIPSEERTTTPDRSDITTMAHTGDSVKDVVPDERMDAIAWLRGELQAEDTDVMRGMMRGFADELMSAEADAICGAAYGKTSPNRVDRRNGYRAFRWDTETGDIDLRIPRLRASSYSPDWLHDAGRCSELAFTEVVTKAYVQGVSTATMEELIETLGTRSVSDARIAEMAARLDELVDESRNRPLNVSPHTYVWVGASAMRFGVRGHVVNSTLLVAIGVDTEGRREILGVSAAASESAADWLTFFRSLVARGLSDVKLVISSGSTGLIDAAGETLPGALWQRCRTDYLRDLLQEVPEASGPMVASMVGSIFAQQDPDSVWIQYRSVVEHLFEVGLVDAAEHLDAAAAEILMFTDFPEAQWEQIWSSCAHDRLGERP